MMLKNTDFEQIIIGGLQRSGTSLTRAIIGSHPEIAIYQWDLGLFTIYYPKYKDEIFTHTQAVEFLVQIFKDPKIDRCDVDFDINHFKNVINAIDNETLTFSDIYMLILDYYRTQIGRIKIGLKTPFNEFYSNDIFHLFPKTKFVHVIRNPLDVAVSLSKARKNWGSFKMQTDEHIIKWKESVKIGLQNEKKRKSQYLMLRYEDIISNPKEIAEKLANFLEVEYHENMIKMNGQIGWKGSNSSFDQNGKNGFHSASIERFKTDLDKSTIRKYRFYLGQEMEALGYEKHNKWSSENLDKYKYVISNPYEYAKSKISVKFKDSVKNIFKKNN